MEITYRPDLMTPQHDAWLLEKSVEAERIADLSKKKMFARDILSFSIEDFYHKYTLRKDDIPECYTEESDQEAAYKLYDECYELLSKLTAHQLSVIYDLIVWNIPIGEIAKTQGVSYNAVKKTIMLVIKKTGIKL